MTIRPTLLILAAGMATRYGSLKQMDGFGPHGETIIDYSIYDAIRAGFGKVVFVIRESIEEAFKKSMRHKFVGKILVDYVSQELDNLPEGFAIPAGREKPWGTGHAVWVAASKISGPFAVINADDFYGYRSFQIMAGFLENKTNGHEYGLVGFTLKNTLSRHGAVSRGLCEIDGHGYLKSVTEQTYIVERGGSIVAQNPGSQEMELSGHEVVSMNMMGFTTSVFPYFETYFKKFLATKGKENIKAEFYLPEVVNDLVLAGNASIKVLPSSEEWFGVTFPNDKPVAVQNLESLIAAGVYPENLWAIPMENESV